MNPHLDLRRPLCAIPRDLRSFTDILFELMTLNVRVTVERIDLMVQYLEETLLDVLDKNDLAFVQDLEANFDSKNS